MTDAVVATPLFLRHLQQSNNSTAAASNVNQDFDLAVFWSVNAVILVLLLGVVIWCCCGNGHEVLLLIYQHDSRSDAEYQASVLTRQQAAAAAQQECPVKRRNKLIQSYRRCQVSMVVEEADILPADDTVPTASPSEDTSNNDSDANDSNNDNASDQEDPEMGQVEGFVQLRHADPTVPLHKVPNCCAICLCAYDVGDTIVWSSNKHCHHAFHDDCITDWLVKMQDGSTPCPCCRQNFTDLEAFRKERRIRWQAGNAFDASRVSFW